MTKQTSTYTLGLTWTKIADAGQTFFLQVLRHTDQALYAYSSAQPSSGNAGHVLDIGETMSETAIGTHLWMRAVSGTSLIAASVGGTSGTSGTRATLQYDLNGITWVQVGAIGESIEMETTGGKPVRWVYSSVAPATLNFGHVLYPGEEYVDAATDSNIWARSEGSSIPPSATLVVTRG